MEKNKIGQNLNKYYESIIKKSILKNKKALTLSKDKKNNGYVRIFRNLIKKKNNGIKDILDKKFNKWKKEAFKDSFFRKTILVRISVSRDKILRNRNSNRLNRAKDIKEDRPKSANKKLKDIKRIDNEEKNSNINNIKLKKNNDFNTPIKESENQIKQIYKKNNNSIINQKKIYEIKKNINNNNIKSLLNNNKNRKYEKNNNISHQNNINKRKEELNSNKKSTPILYTYEPNIKKDKPVNNNVIINRVKNLNTKTYVIVKKNQDSNSFTNFNTPKKNLNTNLSTNTSSYKLPHYDTKKCINLKKGNFSEKKMFDIKRDIRNTYSKKNENKFISVDNGNKYNYYTAKKQHNIKNKFEKENLKKGITTVIQHYLGVKERLDNYNVVQIPN